MKARHWAMLSTFITVIVSLAIFLVIWGLKNPPEPKKVGEFEIEGTKTTLFQAGDCQIYVTKWQSQPEPRFFFSCPQRK